MNKKILEEISSSILNLGANNISVIPVNEISFDLSFRKSCETNACGLYNRCYSCPPYVGEAEFLINKVKSYTHALVYQAVYNIEDSFDFEGMVEAKKKFFTITKNVRALFNNKKIFEALHLGAGGCGICKTCAKEDNSPCRHPNLSTSSLEAYCINVFKLAVSANMKYVNGPNTVTYFGTVMFSLKGD